MKLPKINLYEALPICLLAVFLSLVFTFPAILNLNSKFIGDGGDNYEYASYMGLAVKHINSGVFPFVPTSFWRFPSGFDFSRGFDSYLAVTLGMLLTFIFGLTIAYNLTVLLLMSINGIVSYVFFKEFSKSKLLGIVGMLLYGFSFYTIGKASSHLNLLCVSGIPLLGLSILRIVRNQELSRVDFALFFTSLVFISIGSTQYLIMSLLMLTLYALCLFIFEKKWTIDIYRKIITYKKELFFPAFTALIAFTILYFPHLKAIIEGNFILLKREDTLFKLTPAFSDYVLPNTYLRLVISKLATSTSLPSIEKIVFLGWIEILFFLGFFLSGVKRNVKKIIFLLFILPFVLSLGYGQDNHLFFLPYRFISETFPFSALVETGRYIVIFYFFVVSGIILFLNSLSSKKLKIFLITILLLGAFVERIPSGYYLTSTLSSDPYIKIVKNQDSEAVLDLPINYYYAPYSLLSIYYDKPIVNGYFHWSADGEKERGFINDQNLLNRYICDINNPILSPLDEQQKDNAMLKSLSENNITTIVVHKDYKFLHTVCDSFRARLDMLLPKTNKIFDDEAASVYTINSDKL